MIRIGTRCAFLRMVCVALFAPTAAEAQTSALAEAADTSLLVAVLRHISSEPGPPDLRLDPRPLRADPAIVELTDELGRAVPEFVTTRPDPFEPASPAVVARRSRDAASIGVGEASVTAFPRCPGIMLVGPPELRASSGPVAGCPPDQIRVVVVATPRPGGPYWPGSRVDERSAAGLWTARVIERRVGPGGGYTSAADYVAERDECGGWRIVKVVPFLVKE